MRFSDDPRNPLNDLSQQVDTHEGFAQAVVKATTATERRAALLLIGGNTPRDEVIRRAQSVLRLDRLASYWSHVGLILEWGNRLDRAFGVEVALDPWRPDRQVPERNGVTLFPLRRYLDARRYPNIALATIRFRATPTQSGRQRARSGPRVDYKRTIIDAARHPNRDRLRYRLMDWLAVWSSFTYQPDGQTNPLLQDIPLPGAALCEYAYETGGLDLTPGATAPNACPELVWSTLLYWHARMGDHVEAVRIWRVLRDPMCAAREPLSLSLEGETIDDALT